MRYGSVCSGIEGASVAFDPLGWEPRFFSEIDSHASAVLAHLYPDVRNLGDFTTIEKSKENEIDLLIGGTPCQAFSVAGLRGGLDDARGNLTLEFVRLLQRLQPRWFIWENVPGVLSIDGGSTFWNILKAFRECGYSCGYRVLDARSFGLAQRRRRIFVVGHLGDDWRYPAQVLFDTESLRRHPAAIEGERQANTRAARGRFIGTDSEGNRVELGVNDRHSPTLTTQGRFPDHPQLLVGDEVRATAYWDGGQCSDTIDCSSVSKQQAMPERRRFASVLEVDAKAFSVNQRREARLRDEHGSLTAEKSGTQVDGVITFLPAYVRNGRGAPGSDVGTLSKGGGSTSDTRPLVATRMAVRRLTPVETERLQGFPDDHTAFGSYNGATRPISDTQRYKMVGNAFPVPVIRWLGERIEQTEARYGGSTPTSTSIRDGQDRGVDTRPV